MHGEICITVQKLSVEKATGAFKTQIQLLQKGAKNTNYDVPLKANKGKNETTV